MKNVPIKIGIIAICGLATIHLLFPLFGIQPYWVYWIAYLAGYRVALWIKSFVIENDKEEK